MRDAEYPRLDANSLARTHATRSAPPPDAVCTMKAMFVTVFLNELFLTVLRFCFVWPIDLFERPEATAIPVLPSIGSPVDETIVWRDIVMDDSHTAPPQ